MSGPSFQTCRALGQTRLIPVCLTRPPVHNTKTGGAGGAQRNAGGGSTLAAPSRLVHLKNSRNRYTSPRLSVRLFLVLFHPPNP